MRLHHYTLLFLAIFLCVCSVFDSKRTMLQRIQIEKEKYDLILETAVQDAADCLVVLDRGRNPGLQEEEAVKVFFQSLYAGFGILHDETTKQELREYIPLLVLTGRDGFYLWYRREDEDNGRNWKECISEKFPYAYCVQDDKDGMVDSSIGFTIDSAVYVISGKNTVFYGTRQDASQCFPEIAFLKDKEAFEEIRRKTIVDAISEKVNQYINRENKIARRYGLSSKFSIPYLDEAAWARTLDDIAVVAFFQGYPYGNHITETYNQSAIGGALVRKQDYYYITAENGELLYHQKDCGDYVEDLIPYDSKRECARLGAFPCKKCKP